MKPVFVLLNIMLIVIWINNAKSDVFDVCPFETLEIECSENEVIVVESAYFGRMQQGRCIRENKFIGCRNDVIYLADKWCSGRPRCEIVISINDLEAANKNCESFLKMYLSVEYHCVKVKMVACNGPSQVIHGTEGVLSSHTADDTGCGTARLPWIVRAMTGQNIELSIVDFGSEMLKMSANESSVKPIYGKLKDGEREITIQGDTVRERHLYTSQSNWLSIEILPPERRRSYGFLLKYKKTGCPDLTPPAHAWYKRDGKQAVIGCEWSQKTWHLSCDGRSWFGVVGNCSEPVTEEPLKKLEDKQLPSGLWLVTLVCVAVVVMVITCVIGVVCIRKYRIKQEVQKSMTLQRVPGQGHYDLDPNIEMASMLYLPYTLSERHQQEQGTLSDPHRPTSYLIPQDQVVSELTPIRIWERPLPDIPDKPLDCKQAPRCPTLKAGRTPGDGNEAVSNSSMPETCTNDTNVTLLGNRNKYPDIETQQI